MMRAQHLLLGGFNFLNLNKFSLNCNYTVNVIFLIYDVIEYVEYFLLPCNALSRRGTDVYSVILLIGNIIDSKLSFSAANIFAISETRKGICLLKRRVLGFFRGDPRETNYFQL